MSPQRAFIDGNLFPVSSDVEGRVAVKMVVKRNVWSSECWKDSGGQLSCAKKRKPQRGLNSWSLVL